MIHDRLATQLCIRQSTNRPAMGQFAISRPTINRFARRLAQTAFAGCLVLMGVSSASAQFSGAVPVPEEMQTGFNTITEDDSHRVLQTLISEGFDGRGTGQEGYVRAAHFVAGRLAEYGFKPLGDEGTYFQNLPFRQVIADVEGSSLTIGDSVFRGAGTIGFLSAGASQRTEGPVVIIKANGQETRFNRDFDVSGKIVILVGSDISRAYAQQILGAESAGVIQLASGSAANVPSLIRPGQPAAAARPAIAELASSSQADLLAMLPGIEGALTALTEPGQTLTATELNASIDLKSIETAAMVPNVVGWFPGSDPTVAHEYVAIGAHLDHLGVQGDQLFPGADDNGSGSTAILQIARALHENPIKPRRSVLYIAFAAEEMGLIGSNHYVENPAVPLENCICMLNIDMIGRNEETEEEPATDNENTIHLVGTKQLSASLHRDVMAANEYVGFEFEYDEERVYRRSDHYNFARKEIPSSFLFGGFNPHYHQTTDTMEGINLKKIANCARLYYMTIFIASEHGKYELDSEEVSPPGN